MKKKLALKMDSPCQENWNQMSPTEQGRFCLSCQKEVVNFASMSDKEILLYMSTASSSICGRVEESQLNRVIQVPAERRRPSLAYFWSALLGTLLLTNEADAQTGTPKQAVTTSPVATPTNETEIVVGGMSSHPVNRKIAAVISGTVVDENNEPIPYVTVMIGGKKQGVVTDSSGVFRLNIKDYTSDTVLVFSSVGFVTRNLSLTNANDLLSIEVVDQQLNMTMQPIVLRQSVMGEVFVTNNSSCRRRLGGMTGVRVTMVEKAAVKFKDALGINQIKAYPNPVLPNSVFNLSFSLKTPGHYSVQFTDATGRILAARQLTISSKKQTEQFSSNLLGGAGTYFASITNTKTLETYTTQVLLR